MTRTNIIFVHGTGVRLAVYTESMTTAHKHALAAGIDANFVECRWGDIYGSKPIFSSLPGLSDEHILKHQSEDFVRWSGLHYDPLSELDKLTIRDATATTSTSDARPAWKIKLEEICAYLPSPKMATMLQRADIDDTLWKDALYEVTRNNNVTRLAFER